MKKILLLLFTASFTLFAQSTVFKAVTINSAGTLSASMTTTELNTVTNLTLTGNINACDFKTMRDKMDQLAVVDLSKATIWDYTGKEGTGGISNTYYPANSIPLKAFYYYANYFYF